MCQVLAITETFRFFLMFYLYNNMFQPSTEPSSGKPLQIIPLQIKPLQVKLNDCLSFRLIRPVGNSSDRLTVKMGLKLSQIIGVDMKRQIMITNVWVEQVHPLFIQMIPRL